MKKLNIEVEKANNMRYFLICIVLLILVSGGIILIQQRQKARRKREVLEAKQKLLASELKNAELEKQYLNDELLFTNKELTSFASSIVQNHTFLHDLRKQILGIARDGDPGTMKDKLMDINTMLLQIFSNNDKREEFIEKSKEINYSLIFYLKSNFPLLTESDVNMLILIFLKFTAKEVAILYNIELKSAKQKRYRLRKKLDMDSNETFDEFFQNVLEKMKMRVTG